MTADSAPAGSPLAPLRGSARGPSPAVVLMLLTTVVIGAIALAVNGAPPPQPAPQPVTSALAEAPSASAPASANLPSPQTAPTTRPSGPPATTVVILRGIVDPGKALGSLAGCTPLLRVTGQAVPAISGADVDATATAAGRETGWLFVPPGIQALTRVWLGDDVVELARAAGSPVVAVGANGDVWLGGPAGAARWLPIPTPAGRTAWILTADEVTSHGRCGPWVLPTSLVGQRSVTCASLSVPACLRAVTRVEADTPGVPYAGGDMALVGVPCRASAAVCGQAPLAALAVPAGWPGTIGGVHAALAAGAAAFQLLAPGAAPDYALAAIFHPSLPLPTGAGKPAPACGSTLGGGLRAAPWDPRVFWVGATPVVWPTGSSAQFGDPPALTVPTADGTYRFVAGSSVQLEGSVDPHTGAFVACAATPLSAVAVTAQPSPMGR